MIKKTHIIVKMATAALNPIRKIFDSQVITTPLGTGWLTSVTTRQMLNTQVWISLLSCSSSSLILCLKGCDSDAQNWSPDKYSLSAVGRLTVDRLALQCWCCVFRRASHVLWARIPPKVRLQTPRMRACIATNCPTGCKFWGARGKTKDGESIRFSLEPLWIRYQRTCVAIEDIDNHGWTIEFTGMVMVRFDARLDKYHGKWRLARMFLHEKQRERYTCLSANSIWRDPRLFLDVPYRERAKRSQKTLQRLCGSLEFESGQTLLCLGCQMRLESVLMRRSEITVFRHETHCSGDNAKTRVGMVPSLKIRIRILEKHQSKISCDT